MFKFLRFEIGGITTLFWLCVFLAPHINFSVAPDINVENFFALFLGSIVLALPLGNYIHQITDSIFSPFAIKRAGFIERKSLKYAKLEFESEIYGLSDQTYQVLFLLAESLDGSYAYRSSKRDSLVYGDVDKLNDFDVSFYRDNIQNRYSYYYARIENGLVAPIIALVAALFILMLPTLSPYFLEEPHLSATAIALLAIPIFMAMLWRIPQLFRELDDIEIAILKMNRERIREILEARAL